MIDELREEESRCCCPNVHGNPASLHLRHGTSEMWHLTLRLWHMSQATCTLGRAACKAARPEP